MNSFVCLVVALAALELQPPPQHVAIDQKRVFQLRPDTAIVVGEGERPLEPARAALKPLLDALAVAPPIVPAERGRNRKNAILVGELGASALFGSRAYRNALRDLPSLGPEGYMIRITQDEVVLAGNTARGTYHGLVILGQVARQSGTQWPCLEIRDRPGIEIRAALLTEAPSETELDRLAAAQCNFVILDHPDFQYLTTDRAGFWGTVFREARARQIEAVPSFHLFHGAGPLVSREPLAAEGRITVETLILQGFEPALLRGPRPLIAAQSEVKVTVSGIECKERSDYEILPLADDGTGLWALRRVPGSRIPDSASVEIRYSHVPRGSDALCPAAAETKELVGEAVGRLLRELDPAFLYVGPDLVSRLNEDTRCRSIASEDGKQVLDGLRLLDEVARTERPGLRLLVSDRAYFADGTPLPWPPRGMRLPEGALFIGYGADTADAALVGVRGAAEAAYRQARDVAASDAVGLVVDGADPALLAEALGRAWNPAFPLLAWPEGLNAHFGATLWQPDFETRLAALVGHVNREMRRGATPKSLRSAFDAIYGRLQRPLSDDAELATTQAVFGNLIEYLELEAAYLENPEGLSRTRLAALVERQSALDPRFDAERRDRIVETVENQGLFVPASILFGVPLDYHRPMALPDPSGSVLPLSVVPEYQDLPFRTEARLDLAGFPLHIVRINFETVASEKVLLEGSADGTRYELRQTWTSAAPWGVRGPVLPKDIAGYPFLRLASESKNQTAVLREVGVLALKEAPTLHCPLRHEPVSSLLNALRGLAWPATATAVGFVRDDGASFAAAPTVVRVARNEEHLFLQMEAYEPRMHALVAAMKQRDAALWEEESIEIRLHPAGSDPCWLAFNPLGTQFDARRGDAAWDAGWTVQTRVGTASWSALVTLPLDAFGGESGRGVSWKVDFIRNRSNAVSERSHWAFPRARGDEPAYGTLHFE